MRFLPICLGLAVAATSVRAATSVSPGGLPIQGTLGAGDTEPMPAIDPRSAANYFRDGYSFNASRPGMIEITLSSTFDGYLFLIGPNGNELARNDDFQNLNTARIAASLSETGPHLIIVTSSSPGASGEYSLTVGDLRDGGDASRDGSIRMGQTIQGTLELGDNAALSSERGGPDYWRDGYTFRPRSGQSITVDLTSNFDAYLYLVDSHGTVLVSNDDFGTVYASRIVATPGSSQTHRIVVTSFSPGTGGTYTLSLQETTEETAEQQSQPQPGMDPNMTAPQGWQPQPGTYVAPNITVQPAASGTRDATPGRLEIVSDPPNIFADAGETFITTYRVHNTRASGFTDVCLFLRYDPELLRPLRVSDHKLRPLALEQPQLTSDLRQGWIRYAAALAEPQKCDGVELITVEWRALAPVRRAQIEVVASRDGGSSLSIRGGRNLLGTPESDEDGTVNTDVSVAPSAPDHLISNDSAAALGEPTGLTLRLTAPRPMVRVGEVFDIDVDLLNPAPEAFDEVEFTIHFDPRLFEPIDTAEGGYPPRSGNWITRGVNLLDEPFHAAFPFDQHMRNEVIAAEGLAEYAMGLSRSRPLAGGTLARLRLRARTPADEATLRFDLVDGAGNSVTAIRIAGDDLLNGEAVGITLRIVP